MTMTNDQKFIQALEVISEIAPYTHLKDAIQKARDLAPMLRDDGYKHDATVLKITNVNEVSEVPSEKALSELRDKLTADDDDRPRTPHYAPVGGFENLSGDVKDKAKSLANLASDETLAQIKWPCPSCQWDSSLFPPGRGRANAVRVHIMQLCDNFRIEYPQEFEKFKSKHS